MKKPNNKPSCTPSTTKHCGCTCHSNPHVRHIVPCCSAPPARRKDDEFSDAEWNALESFMESGDYR